VDKIGAWIETYSVKIKWDKLTPTLGTWDISGEPQKFTFSVADEDSNNKILRRRSRTDFNGYQCQTASCGYHGGSEKIEDHYAISGYIQYVEGLEIPFAIMWDYEARKARLFMGDKEWEEKVLR
jgi:hypothetical protein